MKTTLIDMTGQRFGRLLVKRRGPDNRFGQAQWRCKCDCGKSKLAHGMSLRKGWTKSCGCLRREMGGKSYGTRTHGMYKSPEYRIWSGMRVRCNTPTAKDYDRYGGRGITVDPRWDSFENFLADMGKRPSPELSLDRKDNDGPYAKWNCRWATRSEQQKNKRRFHWKKNR